MQSEPPMPLLSLDAWTPRLPWGRGRLLAAMEVVHYGNDSLRLL